MTLVNHSLDQLPSEVIHKIASHLPFHSALSLSSTNSTIRAATNHWMTFKALISNDSHNSQSQAGSRWDFFGPLKENQDIEFWAKYALTDQKAVELFNNPETAEGSKVAAWAPQLVVLRHPLLSHTKVADFYKLASQPSPTEDLLAILFYRMACLTSNQSQGVPLSQISRHEFYLHLLNLEEDANDFDFLKTLCQSEIFPWISVSDWDPSTRLHSPDSLPTALLSLTYKVLPMIYYEILLAISKEKIMENNYAPGVVHINQLPNPSPPGAFQVPFWTFMNLPPPFSLNSSASFNFCHQRVMSTPSFISALPWSGYHLVADASGNEACTFLPSIHNLQFSSTNREGPSNSFISNGFCDSMGAFNIEMKLEDATVKCELMKRYHDAGVMNLPFQSLITPFGIVGTFGNGERGSTRQTHWLWLWRSEWAPAE